MKEAVARITIGCSIQPFIVAAMSHMYIACDRGDLASGAWTEVKEGIARAKELCAAGGDWERKNRLKVKLCYRRGVPAMRRSWHSTACSASEHCVGSPAVLQMSAACNVWRGIAACRWERGSDDLLGGYGATRC